MDFSGKKLLIVDDEPDLREMISFEFDLLNFEVKEASSGSEAIDLLKEDGATFDAIISDIRMPNGDGLSLLKYLSSQKNRCPLVFISGFADLGPEEAYSFGAQSIFSKPFDLQNLVNAISYYLSDYKTRLSGGVETLSKVVELDGLSFSEMNDSFGLTAFGFYFRQEDRLSSGEKFNFKFTDESSNTIEGTARALWTRKESEGGTHYIIGAEIIGLTPESLSYLEANKDTEAYTSPFIPSPKSFS